MKFAQIVRHGSIRTMAMNFGATRKLTGLIAIVSSASISSVTFIVPEFGGKCGTGPANHNHSRNQWPEFTRHRECYRAGHIAHRTEAPEFVGSLQSQNQANEKSDQRENGQRAHARFHRLPDGALKAQGFALEWSNEGEIRGAPGKGRQRPQIRQTVSEGRACCLKEVHERLLS